MQTKIVMADNTRNNLLIVSTRKLQTCRKCLVLSFTL